MREDLQNEKLEEINKDENTAAMWEEFESVTARTAERMVPKIHAKGNSIKHEVQPWVNSIVRTIIKNENYE